MPAKPLRTLAPLTSAVHDLAITAHRLVDATLRGQHRSLLKGRGLEFGQYRSYEPGDDLRLLDWKLFGRSDRYFVREAETESNVGVHLVLDATGSMAYAEQGLSKIDFACNWLAALALLFHNQQDSLALTTISDGGMQHLPWQRGRAQLARIWHQLATVNAGKPWPTSNSHSFVPSSPSRGLILCISDLSQADNEIMDFLKRLHEGRHETTLFHLLGAAELSLNLSGHSWIEDLETGTQVAIDAESARSSYVERLEAYISAVQSECLVSGITYRRLMLGEPAEQALRAWVQQRKSASRP